jgi:hypothetical protein
VEGQSSSGDQRGLLPGDAVGLSPYPPRGNAQDDTIECEVASTPNSNLQPSKRRSRMSASLLQVKMAAHGTLVVKPCTGGASQLLHPGQQWRVDKLANRVSFSRQLVAARVVTSTAAGVGQQLSKVEATTRPNEYLIAALIANGRTNAKGISVEAATTSKPP